MSACRACGVETESVLIGGVVVARRLCDACSAEDAERERAERRRVMIDEALTAAGATPRTRDWSLETYPTSHGGAEAAQVAREWIETYQNKAAPNLYLWGPPGSGKTGLAWGIIRELLRIEYRDAREADRPMRNIAALVDVRAYLAEVREGIRTDRHANQRPARLPVVCLDDLGSERDTEWAVETMGLVIAARYEGLLPTIVTSNYDPDTLAERLGGGEASGGRMLSRLCGGATVVQLTAPDRRI